MSRPASRLVLSSTIVASLLAICFAGCREQAEIQRRIVPPTPRDVAPSTTKPADRMLAAMIPYQGRAWFFKVVGPIKIVAEIQPAVRTFLASVRFGGDSKPNWTLPDGWQQQPGSGMRLATIQIGQAVPPLEMTVISLPMTGDDRDRYLLDNVNRWRQQMGVGPIGPVALNGAVESIAADNQKVWLADIEGHHRGGRMGRPPMDDIHAGVGGRPPAAAGGVEGFDPSLMTLTAPDAWQMAPISGMRKANYLVRDGDKKIEITVISALGDMLGNINRWRGQIQLEHISDAELDKALLPIKAGGSAGKYVELFGPEGAADRQAILGAVIQVGRTQWFIKLKGDAELAEREKSRFKAFVESIKFKSG